MAIAGHEFAGGRCVTCGCRWVDVRGATKSNVGEKGWSCGDEGLTDYYAGQIITEREAEDARIEAAMGHVWRAR